MRINEEISLIKTMMGLLKDSPIILVGGLDYRQGDLNLSQQVEKVKKFARGRKVVGFRYNDSTSQINDYINQNPNPIIFLFSAGCNKAYELSKNKNVDKTKIYIIEPYAVNGNSKVASAVSNGVPAKNVFVGSTRARGKDVISGASSSQSKTHWGALEKVPSMVM
jgi:hypothetical protein